MKFPTTDFGERRVTYGLFNAKLQMCLTLAMVVESQLALGNQESARRALANAENFYASIRHSLPGLQNAGDIKEIGAKLAHLGVRLDALRLKVQQTWDSPRVSAP